MKITRNALVPLAYGKGARKRPVVSILIVLVAAAAGHAQQNRALELLTAASQQHRQLKSFEFEATVTTVLHRADKDQVVKDEIRHAASRPGRGRAESGDRGKQGFLRVSDGRTYWEYSPAKRQYTRTDAAWSNDGIFAKYEKLAAGISSAALLPEETIEIEGQQNSCYVVRTEAHPAKDVTDTSTYWIDKKSLLVRRQVLDRKVPPGGTPLTMTAVISRAVINPPLPDSLFTFTPPPDTRQVEEFLPGRDLTGQSLPRLALRQLDGKEFDWSVTRGKVVLLDFWASWCPPCRLMMPVLDKLNRELGDRGFMVIGLNTDDTPERARQALAETPVAYTVLIGKGTNAGAEYQATGLPVMMMVDRTGKIAGHYGGAADETKLRQRLKEAGIE